MASNITKFPIFDVDGTLLNTKVDGPAFIQALNNMPWANTDLSGFFQSIQIGPYLHKTLPFAFKSIFNITQNIRLHKFIENINKAGQELFKENIINPANKVFNSDTVKKINQKLNELGEEKLNQIKSFFKGFENEKSLLEIKREEAEPGFVRELLSNLKQHAETITPIKGAKEIVEQLQNSKDSFASIITGTWHDIAKFKLTEKLGLSKDSLEFIDPKDSSINIQKMKAEGKIPVTTCDGPDSRGLSKIETREDLFNKVKEGISQYLGESWDKAKEQVTYIADGMWDVQAAQNLKLKFIGVGKKLASLKDKLCHITEYPEHLDSLSSKATVPKNIPVTYNPKELEAANELTKAYPNKFPAQEVFIPTVMNRQATMQV